MVQKQSVARNKCPKCHRLIPVSEFDEHLRIELLDPKHIKIQKEVEANAKDVTTATGDQISRNLKRFARNRPDLFNDQEQEHRYLGDPTKKIRRQQVLPRVSANQVLLNQ